MRPKLSTDDWPEAILIAVLLPFYLFVLPQASVFVRVPIGILITLGGLYAAGSALRQRWFISKTTGNFFGYYLRLAGVAIAIIIAWVLTVFVIPKIFLR